MGYPDFAISRAYYAMFYVASALLQREGMKFSKHSGVIAAFSRVFVKTGRIDAEVVRQLANAQDARNESDYRIAEGTAGDAARYIGYARDFIGLGERLLSEEPSQAAELDDNDE